MFLSLFQSKSYELSRSEKWAYGGRKGGPRKQACTLKEWFCNFGPVAAIRQDTASGVIRHDSITECN